MNLIPVTQHQQCGGVLTRTICSCEICKQNCRVIPGYTLYEDIINIYYYITPLTNFMDWCKLFFLASPGAIVGIKEEEGLKIYRIPTIVPKRDKDGYCIFFSRDEKCSIHPISPFGCRYFDCKQTGEEADNISKYGLMNISTDTHYKKLWDILHKSGLIAKGPEELRKIINEKNMD